MSGIDKYISRNPENDQSTKSTVDNALWLLQNKSPEGYCSGKCSVQVQINDVWFREIVLAMLLINRYVNYRLIRALSFLT